MKKTWERKVLKDEARHLCSVKWSYSILMPLLAALLLTPFTFFLRLLPYFAGIILLHIFIYNPMQISLARARLNMNSDNRKYADLFYGFGRRYLHFAVVMMLCDLRVLISLLLLPLGIIASFQQRLIPYLLAEHPDLSARDAIRISRGMMQDDKMKSFILDLSFIGYVLLSGVTFGLFGILYGGPISEQTMVQLYQFLKYKDAYQNMEQKEPPAEKRIPAAVTSALPVLVVLSVVSFIILTPQYRRINDLRWNPSDKHNETDDRFIETVQQKSFSADELLSYNPKQLGSDAADALVAYLHELYKGDRSGNGLDDQPLTRDEERIMELLTGICASEDAVIWLRLMMPAAERLRDSHIEDLYAAPLRIMPEEEKNVMCSDILFETLVAVYHDYYSNKYKEPDVFDPANEEEVHRRFVDNYGNANKEAHITLSMDQWEELEYLERNGTIHEGFYFHIASIMNYSILPDLASCFYSSYYTLSLIATDVIPLYEFSERGRSLEDLYHKSSFFKGIKCLSAVTRAKYLSYVSSEYEIDRKSEHIIMEDFPEYAGYDYFEGSRQIGFYDYRTIQMTKVWNKEGIALFYELEDQSTPDEEALKNMYQNVVEEIADPNYRGTFSFIKIDDCTNEEISAAVELIIYGERAKQTRYHGIQEIPKHLYTRIISTLDSRVDLGRSNLFHAISMAQYTVYHNLEGDKK